MITKADLERTPALALTLKDVTPDEKPKSRVRIAGLDSSFQLGAVQPRLRGPHEKALFLPESMLGNKSCSPTSAPTSCSNGVPVCSSPTASPFFVLTSLRIKTDHEGVFQGDPEIELYPLRINPTSPLGGSSDVRTNWIFEGRYVTDLAGRSIYLPDVDNNNQWYSITNGLALFPAAMSNSWVSTLVDNDDTTGLLELDRSGNNPVKFPIPTITVNTPLDDFDILKGIGILLIALGILDNNDDLYVQSLEVNNGLFCSQGLGQYPYSLQLTGTEWDLQGHFACIDPACIPDPCAGDPCCGDPCCGSRCCGDPYCIEP